MLERLVLKSAGMPGALFSAWDLAVMLKQTGCPPEAEIWEVYHVAGAINL